MQSSSIDSSLTLDQARQAAARPARGRLRIYFGAAPGVGKTRAMLQAAQQVQAAGRDVLVLEANCELALDPVLQRRPALLVLPTLAHSNPEPARHPKRWQDVDELLGAGIDVFTTLNVYHLESLNNVVRHITHREIEETLPDRVLQQAEQVILIDTPLPQAPTSAQADQAEFEPNALAALRELTLRCCADHVEAQLRGQRQHSALKSVWKTNSALLACIGPESEAEHVIRSSAQLASQLNASWQAIYIETPRLQRLPAARRQLILQHLQLAQSLGAHTAVLSGNEVALTIADYAREQNISKIVFGRSHQRWLWPWSSHTQQLARLAPELDVIEIGHAYHSADSSQNHSPSGQAGTAIAASAQTAAPAASAAPVPRTSRRRRYAMAAGASLLTILLTTPLLPHLDMTNIAMLFLLTVVLVAVRFGREASVVATLFGVGGLVLAAPRLHLASLAPKDLQYVISFAVMLLVGLTISQLTANLRYQARIARHREARSRALYEFARALSGVLLTEQVIEIARDFIQRSFNAHATILLPDQDGKLSAADLMPPQPSGPSHQPSPALHMSVLELGLAQWAFDRATPAGAGTDTLPNNRFFFLPLLAPMRTRGVLAIEPQDGPWLLIPEQRKQLDTFGALAAIALERVHYVEVAQEALVHMEGERLRNSLLAALSHDLRTPLTSLVGLSESLALSQPALSSTQRELAGFLHDEALRMSHLVANLLDMARIQSGKIKLNLQWQTLEEVVGSALRASRMQLAAHHCVTELPPELPLVRFDAVLIERVLCNLLENAAKYTPPGSRIALQASCLDGMLEVRVQDNGPGLPAGQEEAIFEKFTRGERESAIPGVGLGLAICRAIVEAHGGKIRARAAMLDNGADGDIGGNGDHSASGACFSFTLPLGTPPDLSFMDESEASAPTIR